ncbi:MACPF domain-containing protein [Carex littledalei]|uniref:MACPF domain-containing protein n=1 Tax=Carex littledalei TaxID=544730 RepID=A0A833QKG1_9POAL|nr:MACPF domain-containing protein [Carex littledalei]
MEEDMSVADGIGEAALAALGRGFDLANDFRLRFAKGGRGRLVELDEKSLHDVAIPGGPTICRVSRDIGCDKGDRMRFQSDILEFNQMSEFINQCGSVPGKVPSGLFNSLFDLTGAWLEDAKETKHLAFDGNFICLYNLHLRCAPLILRDEVKKAVPPNWDPVALARFIQTYGTHIIVGLSIGGQDMVCVRQTHSSPVSTADLKMHLEDLGNILFEDGTGLSPVHRQNREGKNQVPEVFVRILQTNYLQLSSYSETSNKDGLTVIKSKRGGDVHVPSHSSWLQTVSANPDAIAFKFVPITSLLTGIQGSGYLSHAINLYLRYKPDIEDLRYFLEFQVPLQWAPLFNELALGPQQRKASYPSLQFRCLGPKLQVSTSQVSSENRPVIGLRLYLEGRKCNRLAIHVLHLSSIPSMLTSPNLPPQMAPQWQGSEDSDAAYIEPVSWRRYSCICTSVVKHDPIWLNRVTDGVFIVTGAQLVTKGTWSRKVLHLRLLYSHLPDCTIRKTEWARAPAASQKGSFLSTISTTLSTPFMQKENTIAPKHEPAQLNSGVFPDGPPVPVQYRKLLKFVDMSEVLRGPHDIPGHWMVTAAKLVKENGKIGLHVKFALLNYGTGHEDFVE